ncbi:MAG TPA: MoaD/ThiS family protein [Coprothermobacter proteolyticus]|nr:MoaD/ThiS family protein [Coprothermobacter proteolyticus]HPZ44704.1 MoaD/ThiS family protein [Coprothermobacter proteolyticus]HQD07498.1 MoaD/ThiS family protein [Coprothermobacter proteolyticus]
MALVKVHFMGGFAELGCGDLELEVSNYADLVLKVARNCPILSKYLLNEPEGIKSDFLAFCRGRVISDLSFVFEDGDEIAFYPPVTW